MVSETTLYLMDEVRLISLNVRAYFSFNAFYKEYNVYSSILTRSYSCNVEDWIIDFDHSCCVRVLPDCGVAKIVE